MFLGNPLLPIDFPVTKALDKTRKVLAEKNWSKYELGTIKLVLVPYFFYNYHYFLEEEKNGQQIIKETKDGYLALDGHSLVLNENISKLIKKNIKTTNNTAPELEFTEKETNLAKKEKKKVIQLKSAQFFKIPKENMVISSITKLFVGFYEIQITIEKKQYNITINAIDGTMHGVEEIPVREKGYLELTQETLTDLSNPQEWLNYSKGLILEAGKAFSNSPSEEKAKKEIIRSDGSFLNSKWILVLIMILALFLIYLSFLG